MNESVSSGNIIDGKNRRMAVFFAVTVCALMVFSSFGVVASALAAGPADSGMVSDASSAPLSPSSVSPVDDQSQPSTSDAGSGSDAGSNNAPTSDGTNTLSPVITDSNGNVLSAAELKAMLDQLKNSGSSSKGLDPTPSLTIYLTPSQDAAIQTIYPDYNWGGSPLWAGIEAFPGENWNDLVQFDLSSYVGFGYESLLTSATLSLYETYGSSATSPTAYQLTNSWVEGWGWYNFNDGVTLDAVTWNERWYGQSWLTAGGDYNIATATPLVASGSWYNADVRSIVSTWLDTSVTNNGFIVSDPTAPGEYAWEDRAASWSGNPSLVPQLALTFIAVQSKAGPLAPTYFTTTLNNEFSVPYNALTPEANGLDHINMYYRFSPDNGVTVPWTAWQLCSIIPGAGALTLSGSISFNASYGKGHYEFFTEAVTVDGSIEQNPATADATTFFDLNGPFAPTNVKCWNNNLNPDIRVSWDVSITPPAVTDYAIYWADDPKWIDFYGANISMPFVAHPTHSALFPIQANDLKPDYYVVRAYDSSGAGAYSNNTNTVVNRDVFYNVLKPATNNFAFVFQNMTVAASILTITNSNLGFDWITVRAPADMSVTSTDLVINGDLTILGDVVLNNVNLIMNGSYDGESRIYVAPGASLTVNGGTITNGAIGANYLFKVDGSLVMNNCNLSGSGSRNQTDLDEAGLFVSGSASLDNVWIHDCVVGIIASETATSVQVTNSIIEDCGAGAISYGSSALSLEDNLIQNCGGTDILDGTTSSVVFSDDMESGTGNWDWNVQAASLFADDGESGEGSWTHGSDSGPDMWHLSTSDFNSPTHAWRDADDITNNYDFGTIHNWLISPVINLNTATTPELSFWEAGQVETWYDLSSIYFSDDAGATWNLVDSYYANTPGRVQTYDIGSYVTLNNKFMIMFDFNTHDWIANYFTGWYIDDISIVDTSVVGTNLWEQTTSEYNSATTSWTDSASGNYINNQNIWLQNNGGTVDLTGAYFATLEFSAMYSIAAGDRFLTEVSPDGGASWDVLDTKSGTSSGYGTGTFDTYTYSLNDYVGNSDLLFRFRMTSNAAGTDDGVYIDDVTVSADYPRPLSILPGGGVGAFNNYAGTADSDVTLVNNVVRETTNYALSTDTNSVMYWTVDDYAECSNSGPTAVIDINGDITVTGLGANLYMLNTDATCWDVDVGIDTELDALYGAMTTENVAVSGLLYVEGINWVLPCTTDGEFGIDVTGEMDILLGSEFSTTGAAAFTFVVEPGSVFFMDSSELSDCGYSDPSLKNRGLYIATDDATITYNDIHDCFDAVIADGVAVDIAHNTFDSNNMGVRCEGAGSSGTVIDTNDFSSNSYSGISCMNANPLITGNGMWDNGYGIYCFDSNPVILSNEIYSNEYGIRINNVDINANITGNDIYQNDYYGIWLTATNNFVAEINNNDINDNLDEGIYIANAGANTAYLNMTLNTINDNGFNDDGSGVYVGTANNLIVKAILNDIEDNYNCGLELYATADLTLEILSSNIDGNAGDGLYAYSTNGNIMADITNNNMPNDSDGIYLEANSGSIVSPVIDTNNMAFSGDDGIYMQAWIGITDATITSNVVSACGSNGIYLSAIFGDITGDISMNSADAETDDGIYIDSVFGNLDVTVNANYAYGCGSDGIYLDSGADISADVIGNIAYSSANGYGIYMYASSDIDAIVNMNEVYSAFLEGIHMETFSGTITADVIDNNAYSCGGSNILLTSGNCIDADVSGNDAYSSGTGYGIRIAANNDVLSLIVDGNDVDDSALTGVYVTSSSGSITADVTGNDAYECGDYGIFVSAANFADVNVSGNVAYSAYDGNGIYIGAANGIDAIVNENNVDNAYYSGIYLESMSGITAVVLDNEGYTCGESGIVLSSGDTIEANVSGNVAYSALDGNGIYLGAANGILASLQDNDVDNAYESGIYLESMGSITAEVINNLAYECGEYGIYISGNSADANVSGNSAYAAGDSGIGIFSNSGTLATVQGNDVSDSTDMGVDIISLGTITADISGNTADSSVTGCGVFVYSLVNDVDVSVVGNDVTYANVCGIYINAATQITADVSDNDASDCQFGIMIGDMPPLGPPPLYGALPMNIDAIINNNTADDCIYGIAAIAQDDVSAYLDGDDANNNLMGGIAIASWTGDVYLEASNCVADSSGMFGLAAMGDNIDATVTLCELHSNDAGIMVQANTNADVTIVQTDASSNTNGVSIQSATGDVAVTVDQSIFNDNMNTGFWVQTAVGDLSASITNTQADDNSLWYGYALLIQGDITSLTMDNCTANSNGHDGLYALSYGQVAADLSDIFCSGNAGNGIRFEVSNYVDVSIDGGISNSNGLDGVFITSANSGVDLYVASFETMYNFNDGLHVISPGSIDAMIDGINSSDNGLFSSANGIIMTSGSDITAEIDNSYLDGNWDNGLLISASGAADLTAISTEIDGNGANGVLISGNSVDIYLDYCDADSNGWWSGGDGVWASSTAGALTGTVSSSSFDSNADDGMYAFSPVSVDMDISASTLSSNVVDGLEIASNGPVTLNLNSVSANDNDVTLSSNGCGIKVNSQSISASLDTVEASSNGNDGIQLTSAIDITLVGSAIVVDSNYDDGMDVLAGGDIDAAIDSYEAINNGDVGLVIVSQEEMSVDVIDADVENNAGDGILIQQLGYSYPYTANVDSSYIYSNGGAGVRAVCPGSPSFTLSHSDVVGNGWDVGDSGVFVSGVDNSWIAVHQSNVTSNVGDGVTILTTWFCYPSITDSNISDNGGEGLSISVGFYVSLGISGSSVPSMFNGNGENGINVISSAYALVDINAQAIGNALDGINLDYGDCWIGNTFRNCELSDNGVEGLHISSDNWIGATLISNIIDSNTGNGVRLEAAGTIDANMYSNGVTQEITNNGGDGISVSANNVNVDCSDGYIAWNGGNGFDLTATNVVTVDLGSTDVYDNVGDGLNADAGNDVIATTDDCTIDQNGGDGIDLNAPDELHLDSDWTLVTNNGGDGVNLVGAWYVDFNLMASNSISYNDGDGVEISSSYCDFTAGSAGDVYFEYNGGSGASITTANDPNLDINPDGICSFSYNDAYGLYVSSGDNIDATLNSITADYNGNDGIYLVATNWIGNMDNVHMSDIEAVGNDGNGARLQSLNEDVNAEIYDSTFSWNGGDGLSLIAINGNVNSWVDNCYLDFNDGNGVYLYGQNVYLYPGTAPGVSNSYSFNMGDGIRMEGTNYVWLNVNDLASSYNGGNGVTLIGPDGDIMLNRATCDYNTNGIVVIGGIEGGISDSETDYNANAGISVLGGHDLWIGTSEASYNTGVGIELTNCDFMTLFDNYLEYNGVGIVINNTRDTVIANNDVHYNFLDGIDVINGSDVTLINNIITFNFGWGIFSEPGVNIEWFADSSLNGEYAYAKMNDILLWGNITVEDNSLMTLEDLTTYIGTNRNLQRTIEIASSGEMDLNDATIEATGGYYYYFDVYGLLNTDFATIKDPWEVRAYWDSEINCLRSNILDAGLYGIRAEVGSFVNVLDSYFSGCGFSGMYIESPDVIVSGTTFDTNYRGIWLVDVGPINIEDCSFIDNYRDGILVDDSFATIPFCSFDGNGRGVRVDNNGLGLVDQCWFGSNAVGVDLLNNGVASVTLSTFDDNDVGFYLDTWSYAWVENCTMNSLVQEFSERGSAMAETLNTPFSGPTYIIDNSELWVWWFLDVEVLDEAMDPILGATVNVYDNNGNFVDGGWTDSDGMVSWMQVLNYIKSNGLVDDSMNPQTISVDDGTTSDSRDVMMDHTQTQTFVLNHPPQYVWGSMYDPAFDQGDSFTYAFNLNDCFTDKGDLTFTWISWSPKIGVTVDSHGWVSFYGTDPDWSGSQWVTFRATDEDGLYVEHDVLVTIDRVNTAPTITSAPVVSATQDIEYFYLVTSTDPDLAYGDSLTYLLAMCPSGMSINPSTGLIQWTPAWNQIGINWVIVSVMDMSAALDSQLFAINVANVNDAPYFISTPSTAAVEGTPYSGQFTASDNDLGYGDVLTFSLTTAPTGMIIDPVTGIVYWTPASNQVGNNLVVVKVTDLGGLYDIAISTMVVTNVNQAPVITSTPVGSATQGVQYYYQVTASDLDLPYGDTLTYTLTSFPAGMTIGGATGLISWTPAWNQVGLNWVTVRVLDSSAAFSSQQFAISVANVNDAPTISSTPATAATEGTQYSGTVVAADQDLSYGDVLTFSLTTYPTGMTINSATGLILWTPAYNQVGSNLVVVKVTDLGGLYVTASMTLTVANVNQAPTITSSPITSATQGGLYYYQVTAADLDIPVPGDTLTYSLTAFPAGMTIGGATGLISWTPAWNQVGLNWVTVRVTDSAAAFATQQFSIMVANINDAPVITSSAVTAATEGSAYTDTVTATDLDTAYGDTLTYSLTTSPAGMTIDAATGAISWTPAYDQVGNNLVVVKVTDMGGLYDTTSFTIVVANVNEPPMITSAPVMEATQGVTYHYQATAADVDLPYGDVLTFSLSAGSPWGMTINPVTGLISWIPLWNQSGVNWVTVVVTDSAAASDSQQYSIFVTAVNSAPSIIGVTLSPTIAYADTTINATAVNWTDVEGAPAQYVYQWYLNGVALVGANAPQLSGVFTKGDVVSCEITPFDGIDYGLPVRSAEITISNTAPTMSGASILPLTPVMADELQVTPEGYADIDRQDQTAIYNYQWQYYNATLSQWVNIAGANSDTLKPTMLKIGDKVRCIVTPYDGTSHGESVTTHEVILKETPGTFPAAELASISGLVFATLFFVVLVLYILGKIGNKGGKKKEETDKEAAAPEDK